VRTIADEGRTVMFSSHLLDEVERISDRVAMLKGGRILFTGEMDDIKQRHHRLTLRFDEERSAPPEIEGVLQWERRGHEWTAVAHGHIESLTMAASSMGGEVIEHKLLSLDEIFIARVGASVQTREEAMP
jgi:ABC-2 type transport system ATP-binding protein